MVARTEAENKFVIETMNRQVEQIAKLEAGYTHVATKADVGNVRAEMLELRANMEKLKSDLTWRIVIAMSVLTGIFVAIVRLPTAGG